MNSPAPFLSAGEVGPMPLTRRPRLPSNLKWPWLVLTALLLTPWPAARAQPPATAPATTPPTTAPAAPQAWAIPSADQQAKVQDLLHDIFKDDYADHSPAKRQALSKVLLDQADTVKTDAAQKYVLLREARDLAQQAGDAQLAVRAVDALARSFPLNGPHEKLLSLGKVVRALSAPDAGRTAADVCLHFAGQLADADNYRQALQALDLAQAAAAVVNDKKLDDTLAARLKDTQQIQEEFERTRPAAQTLLQHPDDPDANLALGKFVCFYKGNWDQGLPMLAKGADPKLKALADAELLKRDDVDEQLKRADGWYQLAQQASGPAQARLEQRSIEISRAVLPALTGLDKLKIEKRLEPVLYGHLDDRLNDFANWKPGSGQWAPIPNGFTGSGQSGIDFNAPLPRNCTIEFGMIVLDGLRPRLYFHGTGVYIATEGDARTMSVYRLGTAGFAMPDSHPIPYELNEHMAVKAVFTQDTYEITINGQSIGHGKRPKTDEIHIGLSTGDGWSQGKAAFGHFHVTIGQAD